MTNFIGTPGDFQKERAINRRVNANNNRRRPQPPLHRRHGHLNH
jgi:hypothetical protein